jgi:phenylpropionate dioxygenase-like ring-hydroxylating dioxygenase large terminal subunit
MQENEPTQKMTDSGRIQQIMASRREGYALPRSFYHDSVLYEYELERIWRCGWVFAGYTCQIPQPGDFFTFSIDTDSIIVMRDDEGYVRAFHNVCTHRGTLLYQEETGSVRAIICPYHQWTFSRRGDLLSCYGMQDDIDKDKLGLQTVQVEICGGLIFVSFSMSPPPFEPARQIMAPFARPQGFERAKVAKMIDYEIHANWKLVWENNRECYHCNVNHPQYIKSNFDIYENGQSSARIQQRLTKALARSEAAWQAEGVAISHRQGGLAAFPDADNDIWYSANRTVLTEGYESESMDGQRVAPFMGEYRNVDVGVLRMRTLPNFWNHSSCDHAVTTRLLPAGLHLTRARVIWLVHEDAQEGRDYQLDKLMPFWKLTSEVTIQRR